MPVDPSRSLVVIPAPSEEEFVAEVVADVVRSSSSVDCVIDDGFPHRAAERARQAGNNIRYRRAQATPRQTCSPQEAVTVR